MTLNEYEKQSAVWIKISEAVTERMAVLRQKNDGRLDPEETAHLRGQIAFAKVVLSWGTDTQKIAE